MKITIRTTCLVTLLILGSTTTTTNGFSTKDSSIGSKLNTASSSSSGSSSVVTLYAQYQQEVTRRGWFRTTAGVAAAGLVGGGALVGNPIPASASVFVDPDRYGDKELKVATVNKLRQTIRDSILKDPQLAPLFVKVAIQDALKYDSETQKGGPDGTIVTKILASSADSNLTPLKPAAIQLSEIAKVMKRSTQVTMADVVSFAGAEAIESSGGPRIVVQLGKLDPTSTQDQGTNYPNLDNGERGTVVQAFKKSGLTEREVALLFGTLRAMDTVLSEIQPQEEEEQEENEMGDKDIFIPSSFGGPSEIYGKRLTDTKMDNSVFVSIKSSLKKAPSSVSAVFQDDKVAEWAAGYYVDKKKAFANDLPSCYEKLMSLGERYTGGKIGTLLGGGDDNF
mmetsp:Transcript_18513/g.26149  ORF Transcript_18513/g.26149 Transcript_18513/m.26149 type:complete len:394 (+) Transcript_18513:178-1359(+)